MAHTVGKVTPLYAARPADRSSRSRSPSVSFSVDESDTSPEHDFSLGAGEDAESDTASSFNLDDTVTSARSGLSSARPSPGGPGTHLSPPQRSPMGRPIGGSKGKKVVASAAHAPPAAAVSAPATSAAAMARKALAGLDDDEGTFDVTSASVDEEETSSADLNFNDDTEEEDTTASSFSVAPSSAATPAATPRTSVVAGSRASPTGAPSTSNVQKSAPVAMPRKVGGSSSVPSPPAGRGRGGARRSASEESVSSFSSESSDSESTTLSSTSTSNQSTPQRRQSAVVTPSRKPSQPLRRKISPASSVSSTSSRHSTPRGTPTVAASSSPMKKLPPAPPPAPLFRIPEEELVEADAFLAKKETKELCTSYDTGYSQLVSDEHEALLKAVKKGMYVQVFDVLLPQVANNLRSWLDGATSATTGAPSTPLVDFHSQVHGFVREGRKRQIARAIFSGGGGGGGGSTTSSTVGSPLSTKTPGGAAGGTVGGSTLITDADLDEEFIDDLEDDVWPPLFDQLQEVECSERMQVIKQWEQTGLNPVAVSRILAFLRKEELERSEIRREHRLGRFKLATKLLEDLNMLAREFFDDREVLSRSVFITFERITVEEMLERQMHMAHHARVRMSLLDQEEESARDIILQQTTHETEQLYDILFSEGASRVCLSTEDALLSEELLQRFTLERDAFDTLYGPHQFAKARELLTNAENDHRRRMVSEEEHAQVDGNFIPGCLTLEEVERKLFQRQQQQGLDRLRLDLEAHKAFFSDVVLPEEEDLQRILYAEGMKGKMLELDEQRERSVVIQEESVSNTILRFLQVERAAFEEDIYRHWRHGVYILQLFARLAPSFELIVAQEEEKDFKYIDKYYWPQLHIVKEEFVQRKAIEKEGLDDWYTPVYDDFKSALKSMQAGWFDFQRKDLEKTESSSRNSITSRYYEEFAQLSLGQCSLQAIEIAEKEKRLQLCEEENDLYWNVVRRTIMIDRWLKALHRIWDAEDYERIELELMFVVQEENRCRTAGIEREEAATRGLILLQLEHALWLSRSFHRKVFQTSHLAATREHMGKSNEDDEVLAFEYEEVIAHLHRQTEDMNDKPYACNLIRVAAELPYIPAFEPGADDPFLCAHVLQFILHPYREKFVAFDEWKERFPLTLYHNQLQLLLQEEIQRKVEEKAAFAEGQRLHYEGLLIPRLQIIERADRNLEVEAMESTVQRQWFYGAEYISRIQLVVRRFLQERYMPSVLNLWRLEHSEYIALCTRRSMEKELALENQKRFEIENQAKGSVAVKLVDILVKRMEPDRRRFIEEERGKQIASSLTGILESMCYSERNFFADEESFLREKLHIDATEERERLEDIREEETEAVELYCEWEHVVQSLHENQIALLEANQRTAAHAILLEACFEGEELFTDLICQEEDQSWLFLMQAFQLYPLARKFAKREHAARKKLKWAQEGVFVSELQLPFRLLYTEEFIRQLEIQFCQEASVFLLSSYGQVLFEEYASLLADEFAFFPLTYFLFESSLRRPSWAQQTNWIRYDVPEDRCVEDSERAARGAQLVHEEEDPIESVAQGLVQTQDQVDQFCFGVVGEGGLLLNEQSDRLCLIEREELLEAETMFRERLLHWELAEGKKVNEDAQAASVDMIELFKQQREWQRIEQLAAIENQMHAWQETQENDYANLVLEERQERLLVKAESKFERNFFSRQQKIEDSAANIFLPQLTLLHSEEKGRKEVRQSYRQLTRQLKIRSCCLHVEELETVARISIVSEAIDHRERKYRRFFFGKYRKQMVPITPPLTPIESYLTQQAAAVALRKEKEKSRNGEGGAVELQDVLGQDDDEGQEGSVASLVDEPLPPTAIQDSFLSSGFLQSSDADADIETNDTLTSSIGNTDYVVLPTSRTRRKHKATRRHSSQGKTIKDEENGTKEPLTAENIAQQQQQQQQEEGEGVSRDLQFRVEYTVESFSTLCWQQYIRPVEHTFEQVQCLLSEEQERRATLQEYDLSAPDIFFAVVEFREAIRRKKLQRRERKLRWGFHFVGEQLTVIGAENSVRQDILCSDEPMERHAIEALHDQNWRFAALLFQGIYPLEAEERQHLEAQEETERANFEKQTFFDLDRIELLHQCLHEREEMSLAFQSTRLEWSQRYVRMGIVHWEAYEREHLVPESYALFVQNVLPRVHFPIQGASPVREPHQRPSSKELAPVCDTLLEGTRPVFDTFCSPTRDNNVVAGCIEHALAEWEEEGEQFMSAVASAERIPFGAVNPQDNPLISVQRRDRSRLFRQEPRFGRQQLLTRVRAHSDQLNSHLFASSPKSVGQYFLRTKEQQQAAQVLVRYGIGLKHRLDVSRLREKQQQRQADTIARWFRLCSARRKQQKALALRQYHEYVDEQAAVTVQRYFFSLPLVQGFLWTKLSQRTVERKIFGYWTEAIRRFSKKLACACRGVVTRSRLRNDRLEELKTREEEELVQYSATLIQSQWRRLSCVKRYQRQLAEKRSEQFIDETTQLELYRVTLAQAIVRRHRACRKARGLCKARAILQGKRQRRGAANRLQRWWFHWLYTRSVKEKEIIFARESRSAAAAGAGAADKQRPHFPSPYELTTEQLRMFAAEDRLHRQGHRQRRPSPATPLVSSLGSSTTASAPEAAVDYLHAPSVHRSPAAANISAPVSVRSTFLTPHNVDFTALTSPSRALTPKVQPISEDDGAELEALEYITAEAVKFALRQVAEQRGRGVAAGGVRSPSPVGSQSPSRSPSPLFVEPAAARPRGKKRHVEEFREQTKRTTTTAAEHFDPSAPADEQRHGVSPAFPTNIGGDENIIHSAPFMRFGKNPVRRYHEWIEEDFKEKRKKDQARVQARRVAFAVQHGQLGPPGSRVRSPPRQSQTPPGGDVTMTEGEQTGSTQEYEKIHPSPVPDRLTPSSSVTATPVDRHLQQQQQQETRVGERERKKEKESAAVGRLRPSSAGTSRSRSARGGSATATQNARPSSADVRRRRLPSEDHKVEIDEEVDVALLNEAVKEAVSSWAVKLRRRAGKKASSTGRSPGGAAAAASGASTPTTAYPGRRVAW